MEVRTSLEDATTMSFPGIRDEGRHAEIVERIGKFSPACERKWGVMDHAQLLVHLADGMRMCLHGSTARARGPMRFPPLKYVALHLMKWPEGKIEAPPGAFERSPEGLDEDRETLLRLLDTYLQTPGERLGAEHPAFGKMKPRDWDVLVYRHCEHHLRQFSC